MKLEMMQNKRTVIASTGMHKYAFVNARKIAEGLEGSATTTDEGHFKATFKSEKVAKQFVTEWNAQYEQALANKKPKDEPKKSKGKAKTRAYDPAQEYEDLMEGYNPSKPTPAKRVRKAKGNGIDFNAFKGTKSEKNRALHAELVSRGLKDSRSDEYQAIWQSRPWAKA